MEEVEKALTPPPGCLTIGEVRAEIDRIDRSMVRLIAERQGYIEAAARIKESETDVRDERRIEDVVAKVLAASERKGLSRNIAEPVWRVLIERSIAHEHECWRAIHAPQGAKKAS